MGCDVTEYFQSFGICLTYIHAFWAFCGLFMRTCRYYYRKIGLVIFNMLISIFAAVILGAIYGEMSDEEIHPQKITLQKYTSGFLIAHGRCDMVTQITQMQHVYSDTTGCSI